MGLVELLQFFVGFFPLFHGLVELTGEGSVAGGQVGVGSSLGSGEAVFNEVDGGFKFADLLFEAFHFFFQGFDFLPVFFLLLVREL